MTCYGDIWVNVLENIESKITLYHLCLQKWLLTIA